MVEVTVTKHDDKSLVYFAESFTVEDNYLKVVVRLPSTHIMDPIGNTKLFCFPLTAIKSFMVE